MKQKNNHARSKQRRRALKLKNFFRALHKRVVERLSAAEAKNAPKQKPFVRANEQDSIRRIAVPYSTLFPNGGGGWMFDHNHGRTLNQRQKRKRARHV